MTAISDIPRMGLPGAGNQPLVSQKTKVSAMITLYLFCVVFPVTFNVGTLALTLLRIMLLVMTVPLLIRLVLGKSGRLHIIDILFVLHIIWAVVALAVNNPDRVVQQAGSVGLEFIGGYLVGRTYVRNATDFVFLCKRLVLIVLIMAPFAIYESISGDPVVLQFIHSLPGVTSVELNYQDPRLGLERAQFTFAHPIHYGLFCAVTFSMAYVGLQGTSRQGWRLMSSAIIAGSGFLALSSGALLAIILQLGLILWSLILRRVDQKWWILLGLSVLAYIVVDLLSNRTPIRVFMSYATFSSHTAYWRGLIFEWGMVNVWANPIYGLGLNDWVRPYYMYSGSMDNFWLVMAVRYGIPGFFLVAAGYLIGLFPIIFRKFEKGSQLAALRRAWVFTFCGLTFTLCTVHVWSNIYSFTFFMFGAGMWFIRVDAGETAENTADATATTARPGNRFSRDDLRKPEAPDPEEATEDTPDEAHTASRFTRFDTRPTRR